jgi:methionyl-tRNA formyltransferase
MGTPQFSVPTLEMLIRNNLKPCLVISQPDKPSGRNKVLKHTPIKEITLKHEIECFQPEDINDPVAVERVKSYKPDLIITVAYGAYLGHQMRTMCPYGTINLHPSLLPWHRGADPIRSTLLNGESTCGVTVFFITAKMDGGPIITQKEYPVNDMNYTGLSEYLANEGAEEIIKAIKILAKSKMQFKGLKEGFLKQNDKEATYSSKVEKESNVADFSLSIGEFLNRVNAYSYEPGYYCFFRNKRLKILRAEKCNDHVNEDYPIVLSVEKNKGIVVGLKDGSILIKEVQYEGKKVMSAYEFHIGARIEIGERFYREICDRN